MHVFTWRTQRWTLWGYTKKKIKIAVSSPIHPSALCKDNLWYSTGRIPAFMSFSLLQQHSQQGQAGTKRSRSLNCWHGFWVPKGSSGGWEWAQTGLPEYKQSGESPDQRWQLFSVWSLPCNAKPVFSWLVELPVLPSREQTELTQQLLQWLSYRSRGFLWEVQRKYVLDTQESTAHPAGLGFKRPQVSLCFGLTL